MIRRCASCGKKNRIPAEHLKDEGRCGACKAPLSTLAEPLEADPDLFDDVMRQAQMEQWLTRAGAKPGGPSAD